MANSLEVTLDMSTKPPTVRVDNTVVVRSKMPRFISWHLVGNAAKGRFAGFRWFPRVPRPGIFGPFTHIPGSKWAILPDLHTGARTEGEWVYRLAVQVGRKKYWTKRYITARRKSTRLRSRKMKGPMPLMLLLPASGTPNIKNR
jgi:hypothetical protein